MAKKDWPSIEEQLSEAHAAPGSALEQLIIDNQDFHLLDPEEAHDKIGLPVWLRVLWQKNHPGKFYPRALKNLHRWMLLHQDLPKGSVAIIHEHKKEERKHAE